MKKNFLLALIFLLSAMVVTSSAQDRRVGVAVGNWFKYGIIDVNWSSNDPNATFPPPGQEQLEEVNETEWIFFSVEDVSGTNITFQLTSRLKDGTEEALVGYVDIKNGTGNGVMPLAFISAGLGVNDTLYAAAPSYPRYPPPYITWKINETIFRTYPDGVRETNHLNMTWVHNETESIERSIINLYWDKSTGILVESKSERIKQTGEYLTTWSALLGMTESNVWTVTCTLQEDLEELIETVESSGLDKGIENSLTSKLQAAHRSLDRESQKASLGQLKAFINQVKALRGKKLRDEQADQLIAEAQRIVDLING